MIDEGYIKYRLDWTRAPAVDRGEVEELIRWRDRMHELGLIGELPDGIGFGNISEKRGRFLISGTRTGGQPHLRPEHVAEVASYDIRQNRLRCIGPVEASSEALTHAAIYECDAGIHGVIHAHHRATWSRWLNVLPTSAREVPYGTPEMALEIGRLYRETDLPRCRVLTMAGHENGIIAFGEDLASAASVLLERYRAASG